MLSFRDLLHVSGHIAFINWISWLMYGRYHCHYWYLTRSMKLALFIQRVVLLKTNGMLLHFDKRVRGKICRQFSAFWDDNQILIVCVCVCVCVSYWMPNMNKVSLSSLLGMDFRAALILLPIIFKESVNHHIIMGEVCISSFCLALWLLTGATGRSLP